MWSVETEFGTVLATGKGANGWLEAQSWADQLKVSVWLFRDGRAPMLVEPTCNSSEGVGQ